MRRRRVVPELDETRVELGIINPPDLLGHRLHEEVDPVRRTHLVDFPAVPYGTGQTR